MPEHVYTVIVGNIGQVCRTPDESEAAQVYTLYVERSRDGLGRCAHEPVTLWKDGEPILHTPGQGEE